jgi:tetratricopeptide (TPR) repeat protein
MIYTNSLIFLGRSHLNLKQYGEALASFDELINREPDNDVALMCLGETYTQMGDVDKAIVFLERLRNRGGIQPSLLPIEVKLLNYYSRYFLAKNYEKRNRVDEAIAEYCAAIQMNPRRSEAPTALAQLFANRGNLEEAHRVLDQAIQENPAELENYLNHALLYIDEERYDEAERALQAALQGDPTHSRAHFQLGQLYRRRGNLEAAERSYQQALQNNADDVEAHADLGHLYIEREQFDKAENAFETAIRACSASGKEATLDTQLGYAYSCASTHRRNEVIKAYQEVSRQFPEMPLAMEMDFDLTEAYINLGQRLLDNRLPKLAEYAVKTAVALNPRSDRAVEGLGDVLMSRGKYAEAREQYEKALQLASDRTELFFKLGDCYLKLNAADVARMCYQQGLASNPLLKREA